jgi:hypothetical protein
MASLRNNLKLTESNSVATRGRTNVDDQTIKLEARLAAIEYLLCDLWAKHYRLIGVSNDQIKRAHLRAVEALRSETFPGEGAALSDLAAGELEDAVSRLLAIQREMLKIPQ